MACRVRRARTWSLRIMHECKSWDKSVFVTLTYDDAHLPQNGSLSKTDAQLFIKRLRKNLARPLKYFLGAEYGENTKRPHYHCVLFGVGTDDRDVLLRSWGNGFVHCGNVTHDSACYVASYTLKKLTGPAAAYYQNKGILPEFSLMSRRPGLGAAFAESNEKFIKQHGFCIKDGKKVALPRYYVDRIFNDEERALLRVLRNEFHVQKFERVAEKAGVKEGFQVQDYIKAQRPQIQADLLARQNLKRRKL